MPEQTVSLQPGVTSAISPSVSAAEPDDRNTRVLGCLLIAGGAVAMLAATILNRPSGGGTVAAALFAALLGLVLRFPTMIQDGTLTEDGKPSTSTMRVVVLFVVSMFLVLTVKAGWHANALSELQIDQSWAWILGVVLGGKAVQSFGENSTSPRPKG